MTVTSYYVVILRVDHDGMATPDQLCQGLGMALDDLEIELTLAVEDGLTSEVKISECLGVDDVQYDQVKDLILRREQENGPQ